VFIGTKAQPTGPDSALRANWAFSMATCTLSTPMRRGGSTYGSTANKRQRRPYNLSMYLIAIAWLYVTLLMALTEGNVVAGVLSFVFYGLLPIALLLWLFGGPARRRRAARLPATEIPPSSPTPEK